MNKKNKVFSLFIAFTILINFIPMQMTKAQISRVENTNYLNDELNISGDGGSGYRDSDMANNGISSSLTYDFSGRANYEGVRFYILNPSSTSENKRLYGIDLNVDREKSQRTYTNLYVTDTIRGASVETKNNVGTIIKENGTGYLIPFKNKNENTLIDNLNVNYKPDESMVIKPGRQLNHGFNLSLNDIDYLNKNNNIVMSWRNNYTSDNPNSKVFVSTNFAVGFTVMPWPNENSNLEIMKLIPNKNNLNEFHKEGKEVEIGSIENFASNNINNINEISRLAGVVYDIDGKLIKEAKVRIEEETGKVFVTIPPMAIDRNNVNNLDKNSIFNKTERGIQDLIVKIFARPRTSAEFTKIAELDDTNLREIKYKSPTGQTKSITHEGQNIDIDLQNIKRYDHYNLIGETKIKLDDTRNYDHLIYDEKGDVEDRFKDNILPGVPFYAGVVESLPKKYQGTTYKKASEMIALVNNKHAIAEINTELAESSLGWIVEPEDKIAFTRFKVTPPKNAKTGDKAVINVMYTYANGSKDILRWVFVINNPDELVEKNNLAKPNYDMVVGQKTDELTNKIKLDNREGRKQPTNIELDLDNKITDDYEVKMDENKNVILKAKNPESVKNGTKITIPVKLTYNVEGKQEPLIIYENADFILIDKPAPINDKIKLLEDIPFEVEVKEDPTKPIGFKEITVQGEKGTKEKELTIENGKVIGTKESIIKNPVNHVITVGTNVDHITNKDNQIKELKNQIQEKDDKINDLTNQMQEKDNKINELNTKCDKCNLQKEELEKVKNDLQTKVNELQDQIKNLTNLNSETINKLNETISNLQKEVEKAKNQNTENNNLLREKDDKIKVLEDEKIELKKEIEILKSEKKLIESRLKENEVKIESLTKENQKNKEDLDKCKLANKQCPSNPEKPKVNDDKSNLGSSSNSNNDKNSTITNNVGQKVQDRKTNTKKSNLSEVKTKDKENAKNLNPKTGDKGVEVLQIVFISSIIIVFFVNYKKLKLDNN